MQAFFPKYNFDRYFSWVKKGGFAVLDQALFAGTNFLVSILLARWLEPAAYGAFSTAYAVFLLIGMIHTALWTEPMLVYGSGIFRTQYQLYLNFLLTYHWRFSLISSLVLSLISITFFLAKQTELGHSFIGLAIASPLILYLWIIRRSAYVLLVPQYAAFGGLLYMLIYLPLSFGALKFNFLNEVSALSAMGIAGFFSGRIIYSQTKKIVNSRDTNTETIDTDNIKNLHWGYGRWAIIASSFSWVLLNSYFLILPIFQNLSANANLKALINLIQPMLIFTSAIVTLFLPKFVQSIKNNTLREKIKISSILIIFISILFGLFIFFFGEKLTTIIYDGRYSFNILTYSLLGIVPIISGITNILAAIFRAKEYPKEIAIANFFAAIISILIGVPLTYSIGIHGSLISIIATHLFIALFFIYKLKKKI